MRGSPIRLMILAKGRAARSAAEAGVAIATMPTAPIKNLFIFISNLIRCKSARTRKLTLKGNRISQRTLCPRCHGSYQTTCCAQALCLSPGWLGGPR